MLGAEFETLSSVRPNWISWGRKGCKLYAGKLRHYTDMRGVSSSQVDRYCKVTSVEELVETLEGKSGGVMPGRYIRGRSGVSTMPLACSDGAIPKPFVEKW